MTSESTFFDKRVVGWFHASVHMAPKHEEIPGGHLSY